MVQASCKIAMAVVLLLLLLFVADAVTDIVAIVDLL